MCCRLWIKQTWLSTQKGSGISHVWGLFNDIQNKLYTTKLQVDPAVLISIWYQYQLHFDSRNGTWRMRSHVTLPDTDIITWGWTSSVYLSRHRVWICTRESCDSACVNIGGADKEYICFIARQQLLYLLGKVFNSIKLSEQLLRLGHYEMLLLSLKLSYAKKKMSGSSCPVVLI